METYDDIHTHKYINTCTYIYTPHIFKLPWADKFFHRTPICNIIKRYTYVFTRIYTYIYVYVCNYLKIQLVFIAGQQSFHCFNFRSYSLSLAWVLISVCEHGGVYVRVCTCMCVPCAFGKWSFIFQYFYKTKYIKYNMQYTYLYKGVCTYVPVHVCVCLYVYVCVGVCEFAFCNRKFSFQLQHVRAYVCLHSCTCIYNMVVVCVRVFLYCTIESSRKFCNKQEVRTLQCT